MRTSQLVIGFEMPVTPQEIAQLLEKHYGPIDIIPAKQVREIEDKAQKLQDNLDNGVNVVLSATNDSAIKLCLAYSRGMKGDIEAWIHVMAFVETLIETIEHHLHEEGIDPYAK